MTLDDDRTTRALSFGAIAEDYDRFRPGPPSEAVQWLLPDPCPSAVDIGAGTGALTRLLVGRVGRLSAVEPDPRMAAVLAARVPEATVFSGRAEQMPLRGASMDAVVGSSMWHWVDEPRGSLEVARVLRPGGTFGLLWNGADRSHGWMAELFAIYVPPRSTPAEAARRRHHDVTLPPQAPFSEPEDTVIPWIRSVTPAELIGLLSTYSGFITLPSDEQARRRRHLIQTVDRHPDLVGRAQIDLPMRCACWKAVRQD